MAQQVYTGSVGSALALNYTRNVQLSGGGAGSGQINWVKVTVGMSTNAYGTPYTITITLKWAGGSSAVSQTVQFNSSNYAQAYFDFYFPASTGFNTFESFDAIASADGSKVYVKGAQSVTVDYTVPTNVTAPTAVSLDATSVAPGGATVLRWSGAQGGTANSIKHYEVHRSTSSLSGYASIGTTTGTAMTVYGHSTPNTKYYYKVKTIGNFPGYDSGLSDTTAELNTPVTAVTAPNSVTVSPAAVAPGGASTLSWSGHSAGTNNPISKYEVYMSNTSASSGYELIGSPTSASFTVYGDATPNTKRYFKIKVIGSRTGFDSGQSSAYATLEAPVTAVSAPKQLTLNPTTAAPSGTSRLSWSGAGAGTNNTVAKYEVHMSTSSASTGFNLLGETTNAYMDVTAGAAANSKVYFKVKSIGSRTGFDSALSTAVATLEAPVTAPTVPTVVSVSPTAVAPGANATVSWSGHGAGTNNPIKHFEIWRSPTGSSSGFEYLGLSTSASFAVQAHETPNKSYWYKVKVMGTRTGFDSAMSTAWAKLDAPVVAATAPTAASVPAISETTPTLTFSGAAAGTNNAITGYGIEYSQSTNGTSWGTWTELKTLTMTATSGSTTVDLPSARGAWRKYRIRTLGAAGSSFYSPWKETGALKYNSPPTAPTSMTATPEVYVSGPITLAYGGATDSDNNLGVYQVQYAIQNAGTWGSWASLADNATTHTPTLGVGQSIKYRVRATDTLGAVSDYVESNVAGKNTPPAAPVVNIPAAGRTTLSIRPRFLLTVGQDFEDNTQTLTAAGYTLSRSTGLLTGDKVVARRSNNVGQGTVAIEVVSTDKHGEVSAAATRNTTYAAPAYTDPQIELGTTRIKAAHMNEIRANVNTMRTYYGLAAKTWAETIVAGRTSTRGWQDHVIEIRAAIMDVINLVNGWDVNSASQGIIAPTWLPLTRTPSAAIMMQLRATIATL